MPMLYHGKREIIVGRWRKTVFSLQNKTLASLFGMQLGHNEKNLWKYHTNKIMLFFSTLNHQRLVYCDKL